MFWSSCIFCCKLEANPKFAQNEKNTLRMAQLETLNHINMHDSGLQKEMGSALNAARTAGRSAWRASRLHASQYLCSDEREAPSAHTDTCTFELFVSSLPLFFSFVPKKATDDAPSSTWNLMIVSPPWSSTSWNGREGDDTTPRNQHCSTKNPALICTWP